MGNRAVFSVSSLSIGHVGWGKVFVQSVGEPRARSQKVGFQWDLSGSLVGFQWEFSGISVGVWWDWCGPLVGTAHPEPESGNLVGFKWEFGGLQVGAWWDLSGSLVGFK